MHRLTSRAFLSAVLFAALTSGVARAQDALPSNPNIVIDYIEPMDPARLNFDREDSTLPREIKEKLAQVQANYEAMKRVRERLMNNRLLERFSLFLAPLKLPTTLRLRTRQCDEANAFYNRTDTSITLCYEYVQLFEQRAPKETTPQGITREDAIIGAIVGTLLHETGHALFSIYRVPVLGREEDAADQIAGFVMLQFGRDAALTTIKGSAWKWANQDWSNPVFHDVHSTPQQRFYNFLCIAYGGDPDAFKKFIDIGWLPKWRAPLCAAEYQQVKLAFEETIAPQLDADLTRRVQETKWLDTYDTPVTPTPAAAPAPATTAPATNTRPTATTGQQPARRETEK
jgi:hypothetical protein